MTVHATTSYADAIQRIDSIHARDTEQVNPIARSHLLTHNRKTARAILLWHGYTSTPRLFYKFAPLFFDRGYNVWMPRLPHSGLVDRLTDDHARLTRDEIAQFATETLDAVRGLGDHLTVAGESLGGMLAGWAAQYRTDVDLAAMINPSFALHGVPQVLNTLLSRFLARLPNIFSWWDPRAREKLGPLHAYPRFSTHALAQIFLVADQIYQAAKTRKPAAKSILSITSSKDVAVNRRVTAEVVSFWRQNGATVREYEFQGAQVPVLHDIIDPEQPNQKIDYFYPLLVDLITQAKSPR